MEPADHFPHVPAGRYWETIEALRAATGPILASFAQNSQALHDRIIRNFIARGATALDSLAVVWRLGNYSDCWVLYRALLDRFLHLAELAHTKGFDAFEKHSFVCQFEAKNRLLSDPAVRGKRPKDELCFTVEQKARYKELKAEGVRWKRPNARDVAKRLGLLVLYNYGYDYASTHVHPMANDGEESFASLLGSGSSPGTDDAIVLSNGILVQTMLVQEGLNASGLKWRALIYNLLDDIRAVLGDGDTGRLTERMRMLASCWPRGQICEPRR